MERTNKSVDFAVTVALHELHAAMPTGVVKRLDPIVGAHDDDRLAEIRVFDPIADVRHLLAAAGHLPYMRPDALALDLVELFVVVALGGNAFAIRDFERHGTGRPLQHLSHKTPFLHSQARAR